MHSQRGEVLQGEAAHHCPAGPIVLRPPQGPPSAPALPCPQHPHCPSPPQGIRHHAGSKGAAAAQGQGLPPALPSVPAQVQPHPCQRPPARVSIPTIQGQLCHVIPHCAAVAPWGLLLHVRPAAPAILGAHNAPSVGPQGHAAVPGAEGARVVAAGGEQQQVCRVVPGLQQAHPLQGHAMQHARGVHARQPGHGGGGGGGQGVWPADPLPQHLPQLVAAREGQAPGARRKGVPGSAMAKVHSPARGLVGKHCQGLGGGPSISNDEASEVPSAAEGPVGCGWVAVAAKGHHLPQPRGGPAPGVPPIH